MAEDASTLQAIQEHRDSIDAIDERIVELLNELIMGRS